MKKAVHTRAASVVFCCAFLLAGCGGGGGGGGSDTPQPAPVTFPLRAAFSNQIVNGSTFEGTLEYVNTTGPVPSSSMYRYTSSSTPAVADTFEGQSAQSITQYSQQQLIDELVHMPSESQSIVYYDSNYNKLGELDTRFGAYTVVTESHPLPLTIQVNDSGPLNTQVTYWSRDKIGVGRTSTGTYVIEVDTATSVIYHTTSKSYDEDGVVVSTSDTRYRLDTAGNINLISSDSVGDEYSSHILPN